MSKSEKSERLPTGLFDGHADWSEDGDLRHTAAEFQPHDAKETTIWADDTDAKGNPLSDSQQRRSYKNWKYDQGVDGQTHAGESRKGPFVRDDKEIDNVRICQAVCQQLGIHRTMQEQVERRVRRWPTNSFSRHYEGIYGMVLAAIAVTIADSTEEALESPWIQDPVYQEVAEKNHVDIEGAIALGFKKEKENP